MPLQATSGAASYDAFGGGVPVEPVYIEQIFSTYLYTGNGSTQTITNGIDLSTKGGLVWIKRRDGVSSHGLFDTARGVTKKLKSDTTGAQTTVTDSLTAFNTNGFSVGLDQNYSNETMASWTFRKQPKFFDVVTWSGNGTTQAISHNLGAVPGFIIIKRTSLAEDWWCFHRYDFTQRFKLNATNAAVDTNNQSYLGNNTVAVTPTSTTFTIGSIGGINSSGDTFVAYLFAHNAGGFGLTGSDNVISCGSASWSGGSDNVVNLGYEAQWVMYKRTDDVGNWMMWDTMRGMSFASSEYLRANLSDASGTFNSPYAIYPNATGFTVPAGMVSTGTYIYIAIRRGPMKVPTSGTSVFSAQTYSGSGSTRTLNATIVPDVYIGNTRDPSGNAVGLFVDRLRGNSKYIRSTLTDAETGTAPARDFSGQTGFTLDGNADNVSGRTYVSWFMRRAPSFFDEVCYTGTGSATTFTHNLGVAPELMIVKSRSAGQQWSVYTSGVGPTGRMPLQLGNAADYATVYWNDTAPTSSVFTVGSNATVNQNTATYVAYLFATCAGVSKVGSYTGNGSSQTINCGFTGGARFVMIKATSTTGDWMVADSARGIVAGSDPYLELNNTNAEVTGEDWLDTDSTGFVVNEVSGSNANTNGVTYIFLAIA